MEPQTEFKNIIDSYPEGHDLQGYPFANFVALAGPAFDEFLSRATFKHKGDFSRLHKVSQPTQGVASFAPTPNLTAQQMVDFYTTVGDCLKSSPEIQQMKMVIDAIKEMRPKTFVDVDEKTSAGIMPFVIFEGSSQMGKTQSFWSLEHLCDNPCLYIPLSAGQQTLHTAFADYNLVLKKCLRKDAEEGHLVPPKNEDMANADYEVPMLRASSSKFYTLGFLRSLLQQAKGAKTESTHWLQTQSHLKFDYVYDACSCQELATEGLFVLGLDEVQALHAADLQLLRNLVRAAGGIVVMMGTSSSIVNIISASDKISRETPPLKLPWSYLVVKFPSILPTTLTIRCPGLLLDDESRKFLEHVMENHGGIYGNRPGFVVSVAQTLSGKTDSFSKRLRNLIPEVRGELYGSRKRSDEKFLRNQRRLLCARYAEGEEKEMKTKPTKKARKNGRFQPEEGLAYDPSEQSLIIDHYAHLSRRDGYIEKFGGWVLYNLDQVLHYEKDTQYRPFRPNIVFPVASDECLLHLLFSYQPFVIRGVPTTTREVFRLASVGSQSNANSRQQANDGMGLEACFCASVMSASHFRDVKDQLMLVNFLPLLASELIKEKTTITLSEDAKSLLQLFDRSIPRFAPPNMPLCDYYDTYLPLGTISRTRNEDGIDCEAYGDEDEDPVFTGEMKSWGAPVDVGKLLDRVRDNSSLHFVASNYVPETTKKSRKNTIIRSVSVKDGIMLFHRLQLQEDPADAQCLVLFFALSEMGLHSK